MSQDHEILAAVKARLAAALPLPAVTLTVAMSREAVDAALVKVPSVILVPAALEATSEESEEVNRLVLPMQHIFEVWVGARLTEEALPDATDALSLLATIRAALMPEEGFIPHPNTTALVFRSQEFEETLPGGALFSALFVHDWRPA